MHLFQGQREQKVFVVNRFHVFYWMVYVIHKTHMCYKVTMEVVYCT